MAGFIEKQLPHKKVKRLSFAYPLKEFVHAEFDIPKNHLYGTDAEKNHPLCTWGEIFTGLCLSKYNKKDRALLSAREIMQVVGTDVMRQGNMNFLYPEYETKCRAFIKKKFGAKAGSGGGFDGIWIELALMDIKVEKARGDCDIAVISDVRFHNERLAVAEAGGINVRLHRDTGCDDSIPHPSELELDEMKDKDFTYMLTEDGNKNLKQLAAFTTRVLMDVGLIEVGGIAV